MKNVLIIPALLFTLNTLAQSDTIVSNGKTITGSVTKLYKDHLLFKDENGTNWLLLKESITRFNIRSKAVINGVVGYEWVSNPALLYQGNHPEFKDMRFHTKQAGIWAITSGCMIVGGSLVTTIGSFVKDNGTILFGTIAVSAGFTCIIPTGISLLKAGKTKSFKTL